MEDPSSRLLEVLLTSNRTLALRLNEKLAIRVVLNAPLLVELRGHAADMPASLEALLHELLPAPRAAELVQQINAGAGSVDDAGMELGSSVMRPLPGGGADRYVTLSLHGTNEEGQPPLLLLIRDATSSEGPQRSLARTRQSLDAALAMLRAPAREVRLFLTSALTTVGALRTTMKVPARDQPAVHAKLAQLLRETEQLGADADKAGIDTVVEACAALGARIQTLVDAEHVSGDAMLPLAPLLDQVASSVGDCLRIEELRHTAASPAPAPAPVQAQAQVEQKKEAAKWARSAERSWGTFLRRLGEELGTLVKLQVQNAEVIPVALRRDVDLMLQHLLRNAVEHGIETPEERVAIEKPVTGEVVLGFRDMGQQGLSITVRDDGRGFDVERIGRAAVKSGLLSEESLLEYDPGEIVGLIFKPGFSTANLDGEAGRGRGMSYLRRAVARLGGQVTVATKPGAYTRFAIQLPEDAHKGATPATAPPQ